MIASCLIDRVSPPIFIIIEYGMPSDIPQLLVLVEPKPRDGRVVKVEASTRIIKKGNTIERILVVVRDITGRE